MRRSPMLLASGLALVATAGLGVAEEPRTAFADKPTCKPYCSEPCSELKGNHDLECGSCDPASDPLVRCYPSADGYRVTAINLSELGDRMREEAKAKAAALDANRGPRTPPPFRLHDIEVHTLETGDPVLLSRYANRVLLVVNLASHCRYADSTCVWQDSLHACTRPWVQPPAPTIGHAVRHTRTSAQIKPMHLAPCSAPVQYAHPTLPLADVQLNELHERLSARGLSVLGFPSNSFFQEYDQPEQILQYATTTQRAAFDLFRPVEVNGPGEHPLYAFLKNHTDGADVAFNYEAFAIDRSGAVAKRWPTGADLVGAAAAEVLEPLLDVRTADADAQAAVHAALQKAFGADTASASPGAAGKPVNQEREACEEGMSDCAQPDSEQEAGDGCQRIGAAAVNAMSVAERAYLLSRPTVLTGLIRNDESGHALAAGRWAAFDELGSVANFSTVLGSHDVLARRTTAGVIHMQTADPSREHFTTTSVRLADLVTHRDHEQIVIYDGEVGRSDAEDALLEAVGRFFAAPPVLGRTSAVRVLSFGGGLGVRMANHGFAWLGQVCTAHGHSACACARGTWIQRGACCMDTSPRCTRSCPVPPHCMPCIHLRPPTQPTAGLWYQALVPGATGRIAAARAHLCRSRPRGNSQ